MFTRQVSRDTFERHYRRYGGVFAFRARSLLRRLDWHSYPGDYYGATHGRKWDARDSISALAFNTGGHQETMFKHIVYWDDLDALYVHDDTVRNRLLGLLRQAGITRLGGRPIEDVVKVRH